MKTKDILKKLNLPLLKFPIYNLLAGLSVLLIKVINDCYNHDQHGLSKAINAAATGAYVNLAITCYTIAHILIASKNCPEYYYYTDHSLTGHESLIQEPQKHPTVNPVLNGMWFSYPHNLQLGVLQFLIKYTSTRDLSFTPFALSIPCAASGALYLTNHYGKCEERRLLQKNNITVREEDNSLEVIKAKKEATNNRNELAYKLLGGLAFLLILLQLLEIDLTLTKDGYQGTLRLRF